MTEAHLDLSRHQIYSFPMKTITVAELRQNPTEALKAVEGGETYLVTRHRSPVAKLTPIDAESTEIIPPRTSGGARLSERRDWPRKSRAEVAALLADMDEDR